MFLCVQGHAVEQGHDPQGVRGLHPQAAAGAAEGQGAGEPAEEAGAHQPPSDAEDTGERRGTTTSASAPPGPHLSSSFIRRTAESKHFTFFFLKHFTTFFFYTYLVKSLF